MAYSSKQITLPKALLRRKEGVAILPLEEYERMKEDLAMLASKRLPKDIAKAREDIKKGRIISLEELEKKLAL